MISNDHILFHFDFTPPPPVPLGLWTPFDSILLIILLPSSPTPPSSLLIILLLLPPSTPSPSVTSSLNRLEFHHHSTLEHCSNSLAITPHLTSLIIHTSEDNNSTEQKNRQALFLISFKNSINLTTSIHLAVRYNNVRTSAPYSIINTVHVKGCSQCR